MAVEEFKEKVQNHPVFVVIAIVSAVVFASKNFYFDPREEKLAEVYKNELQVERTRISFSIGENNSFIEPNVFLEDVLVTDEFKRLKNHMVLQRQDISDAWIFKENSISDMISDVFSKKENSLLQTMIDLFGGSKVECYEQSVKYSMQVDSMDIYIRPRVCFYFYTWTDLKTKMKEHSYADFDYLSVIQREKSRIISSSISQNEKKIEEIQSEKLGLEEDWMVDQANCGGEDFNILSDLDDLGGTLAAVEKTQSGRVITYISYLSIHGPEGLAEELSESVREHRVSFDEEKKAVELNDSIERENIFEKIEKISNDDLFFQMFSLATSQGALSPFGNYQPKGLHLKSNKFLVHGFFDVPDSDNVKRIHTLSLGFKTERGIHEVKMTIPVIESMNLVREALAIISAFRIIEK